MKKKSNEYLAGCLCIKKYFPYGTVWKIQKNFRARWTLRLYVRLNAVRTYASIKKKKDTQKTYTFLPCNKFEKNPRKIINIHDNSADTAVRVSDMFLIPYCIPRVYVPIAIHAYSKSLLHWVPTLL